MQLVPTTKVLATAGAALGMVLGAAGITAAATSFGSAPGSRSSTTVHQEPTSDQGNVDFTPVTEQGKPEIADANDTSGADPADAQDGPESTNAAPGPTSGSTTNG
jgi:hypothetical protein